MEDIIEMKKNIGTRIKNIRSSKDLTATNLAKLSFISQSYLSDIETGRTLPSLDTLVDICNALEISLSDFFSDSSNLSSDILRLINNVQKLEDYEIKELANFIEAITKNKL